MEPIRHDIRLSETVAPFGVGAIIDIRGESLIAPDTSWWDKRHSDEISCDRLMSRVGAGVLRQAPAHAGRAAKETPGLTYWRFPAWRFCERCTKLSKVTRSTKGRWVNRCECGGALVPMRYVAVCTKGSHMQDIPWFMWAHRGHDSDVTDEVRFCKAYKELKFVRSAKLGEGLRALSVQCNACGRSRSMAELVTPNALLRDGISCSGKQPWVQLDQATPCEHELLAVQRGATGNYIAERLSALDIPEERPDSVELADRVRIDPNFDRMVADNGGPQAHMIAEWIARDVGMTVDQVLAVGTQHVDLDDTPLLGLKDGEWSAFAKKLQSGRDDSVTNFVVDGVAVNERAEWPRSLTDLIAGVGQVRKVREVRALLGFRRHDADSDLVRADLGLDQRQPTYPAIEMFGEGIFLRIDEGQVAAWEDLPEVQARAEILIERRRELPWAQRLDVPEPRFIALHTLSHFLMRRLAFESGYSSASLQERIYANSERADKTAGILIYTAAGDAQGTLGGLVRLGHPGKLIPLLVAALDEADVCSNDPVCIESDHQGSSSLNLSACHGCALVSETSCECGNRLLDRQLVLGGRGIPGLFDGVLGEVRRAARPANSFRPRPK
ncbi:DUF1998 domain-containing protein [Aeromicrobium panaciterrae]|uniref:DUF1998 domain-containing protein n=1 Tax=Aeromicrobium panaciterrae TaxID=363861 RepID=UPI0031CDEC3C